MLLSTHPLMRLVAISGSPTSRTYLDLKRLRTMNNMYHMLGRPSAFVLLNPCLHCSWSFLATPVYPSVSIMSFWAWQVSIGCGHNCQSWGSQSTSQQTNQKLNGSKLKLYLLHYDGSVFSSFSWFWDSQKMFHYVVLRSTWRRRLFSSGSFFHNNTSSPPAKIPDLRGPKILPGKALGAFGKHVNSFTSDSKDHPLKESSTERTQGAHTPRIQTKSVTVSLRKC